MTRKLVYLIVWASFVCSACNAPSAHEQTGNGQAFVFSTKATESELRSPQNWCNLPFDEAVVINAEPANLNRRYFAIADGVYKVVVRRGNTAAPFMLRRRGASVEVLTSDQFPTCLARKQYFSLTQEGQDVTYSNPPYYQFRMEQAPWQGAVKVTLEFPSDADYGLIVHREKNVE